MKRAIVVGSGAGGAMAARELQGKFEVTILEAGREFQPFTRKLSTVGRLKKTGLLFDERLIHLLFPGMRIRKAGDRMVLVNGAATGGTTTISTGNGVRKDEDLRATGIDLDAEFTELLREVPISTEHQKNWHEQTRQVFDMCRDMGLEPAATPKMAYGDRCTGCGRCTLGCPRGAKWDSRQFVNEALGKGARLITGCKVEKVAIANGRASGVQAISGWQRSFYPADLVILAAGGLGTPVILQNSGIACEPKLFVDPVLCVATRWEGCRQAMEIPMPFIVQRERFIMSPYFDFLSFFFNKNWKAPIGDIFSIQIKVADSNRGSISRRGIQKSMTDRDREIQTEGVRLCREIFRRLGMHDDEAFLGTLNAGHPGGMLPLTEKEAESLHHDLLPENLYVADATLFPRSLGNPPILTIMAIAKRVSRMSLKYA